MGKYLKTKTQIKNAKVGDTYDKFCENCQGYHTYKIVKIHPNKTRKIIQVSN